MRKHLQKKHKHFSWIPVKDIKIPHMFKKKKKNIKASWALVIAQKFTTPYYLDVDSPFQPVHINSTSSPWSDYCLSFCVNYSPSFGQSRTSSFSL